jgi:integration host factor subunit alpha
MSKQASTAAKASSAKKNKPVKNEEFSTMTKANIVDSIHGQLEGFSKKEAADLVERVFDLMKDTLAKGEKLKISGFGNFVVRSKKERLGRNPQTGQPITISPRKVVTFQLSPVLRDAINIAQNSK